MSSLDEQLGLHRAEISTNQWSASIGELFSLYERGKLEINPAFQRFFRWSDTQKTYLVESVLLGLPIPPLFFAQTPEGVLEVVDGVQRISTLLQLRGILTKPPVGTEDPEFHEPLVMEAGQYLSALDRVVWDADVKDRIQGRTGLRVLTEAQRSDVEFAKLDATIIQRSGSSQSKYDVFRRLNSYGEPLTQQEMRAAMIASISGDCLEWLGSLARDPDIAELLSLSERQIERQFDVELVLRFFFLVETEELRQSELRDFAQVLDDYGLNLASEFPSQRTVELDKTFTETLALVADSMGSNFFRRYDQDQGRFKGPFLNTSFEALGSALGYRSFRSEPVRTDLMAIAEEFWRRPELAGGFSTGRSTESRLSTYVPLGRELVVPR